MRNRYSIHILNYNYNPGQILESLSRQITPRTENITLVFWDDGSDPEYRNMLTEIEMRFDFPFIFWNINGENIGRTGMRQKILHSTKDGWIVSIDSDMIPDHDFVDQMIVSLQDPGMIYTGNHYYQDDPPESSFLLHWHYGRKREVPAQNRNPYVHFSTGVYAIHQSLANNLYFDGPMQTYGHEDTLFGLLLQEKSIPVRSTSMNALHAGLSNSDEFIKKQMESVRNLQIVLTKYPTYKNRLIQWSERLNKIPGMKAMVKSEILRQLCLIGLRQIPMAIMFLDLLKFQEYLKIKNQHVL